MRIKFVKDYRGKKQGDTTDVSPNEAFGLIDSGVAIISKDLTPGDYKQAGENNGKYTKLRPNDKS
jgi:hypothetical protein